MRSWILREVQADTPQVLASKRLESGCGKVGCARGREIDVASLPPFRFDWAWNRGNGENPVPPSPHPRFDEHSPVLGPTAMDGRKE